MATLQSSGTISLNDIAAVMGGSPPHYLSEYYRGGALTPATKSSSVREPSVGEYYIKVSYSWMDWSAGYVEITWNSIYLGEFVGQGATSFTIDSYTYYRGAFYELDPEYMTDNYGIYRTSGSGTVDINTNVPSSGTISLSHFYGAEKP